VRASSDGAVIGRQATEAAFLQGSSERRSMGPEVPGGAVGASASSSRLCNRRVNMYVHHLRRGREPVAGEFDDIRSRLEAISEELTDLAIVRLKESIDAGGTELPVDERRLTRARRAVDKAAAILSEPDDAR